MKIKTSELTGAALDWAVAKVQGYAEVKIFGRTQPSDRGWVEVRFNPEPKAATARFDPSENWAQGGEIVEREGINTSVNYQDDAFGEVMYRVGWKASYWNDSIPGTPGFLVWAYGDTALIAAMRCIAVAKLGKEIDIPQELL